MAIKVCCGARVHLTVVASAKSMNSNRFSYFLRVRYGECDAQKVVFNSRYGEYVDLAAAEFLRVLGFEHEIQTAELDYQVVKQTTRVARAGALRPGAGDLGEHEAPGHDVVHAGNRVPHRRRRGADRDQRDACTCTSTRTR